MRTRLLKPSTRPCLGGHDFQTYEEYERACENIRPWPGEDLLVGECRRCHSTIAWKIHPTRWPPEENPMYGRKNPELGTHPDLFEKGETPVFVPLADVPREKLVTLKRHNFTDDEWDELDDDVRDEIVEGDTDRAERIEKFVEKFVQRWKWEADPSSRGGDLFNEAEGEFEYWIGEAETNLVDAAEEGGMEAEDLIASYVAEGYSDATVRAALEEVLRDSNLYKFEYSDSESYRRPNYVFATTIGEGNFYLEKDELDEVLEGMYPDEVEEGLKEISDKTNDDIDLKPSDLDVKYALEFQFSREGWIVADPDWDQVTGNLSDALADKEPDAPEEEIAPSEREVYRWPDGFYVLDLQASELPDEGKAMGMCVGRPDMGYAAAVRRGEIKILSLRRPAGKPLFTIEAELGPKRRYDTPPEIAKIEQVKGKANRLPGFDFGQSGRGTVKKDEVERVIEFFAKAPIMEDVNIRGVRDLQPALAAVDVDTSPWGDKMRKLLRAHDERRGAERPGGPSMRSVFEAPRENPRAPACVVGDDHSQCVGFCRPYRGSGAA